MIVTNSKFQSTNKDSRQGTTYILVKILGQFTLSII